MRPVELRARKKKDKFEAVTDEDLFRGEVFSIRLFVACFAVCIKYETGSMGRHFQS